MRWKDFVLEVRLPRDAPKLDPGKLFSFLETKLGIDVDTEVECVQPEYKRKIVSVTFKSKDRCAAVAEKDDGQLLLEGANGAKIKVSLFHSSSFNKLVRVLDLPWKMPSSHVMSVLSQYGTPLGEMQFEYWRRGKTLMKVSNGTRVVRMCVTKPIPSYLNIQGVPAVVLYEGQAKTCAMCGSTDHLVKVCPRKQNRGVKTWATVASGPRSPPPTPLDTPDMGDLVQVDVGGPAPSSPLSSSGQAAGNQAGLATSSGQSGTVLPPGTSPLSYSSAEMIGGGDTSGSLPTDDVMSLPPVSNGGADTPVDGETSPSAGHTPAGVDSSMAADGGSAAGGVATAVSDTPAEVDSRQTSTAGGSRLTAQTPLQLRAPLSSDASGTREEQASSEAGVDTPDTVSSRFDWAETSLAENFLHLRGYTPNSQPNGNGNFFVNASPAPEDDYVDPFTSSFMGVLAAKRKKEEEEKKKKEEEEKKSTDEEKSVQEGWQMVKRHAHSRARSGEGIPGLTGGNRQPLSEQQRIKKAMAAPNDAAVNAHVQRIKRQRSDLRSSQNKKSKEQQQ